MRVYSIYKGSSRVTLCLSVDVYDLPNFNQSEKLFIQNFFHMYMVSIIVNDAI